MATITDVEERVRMLIALLHEGEGTSFEHLIKDPEAATAVTRVPLQTVSSGEEESSDPRVMDENVQRAGRGIERDENRRSKNMAKRPMRTKQKTAAPGPVKDKNLEGSWPMGDEEMAAQWLGDYGTHGEIFDADADRTRQPESPQRDATVMEPERITQKDYGDYQLKGPDVVVRDAMSDPKAAVRQAVAAMENAVTATEKAKRWGELEEVVEQFVQRRAKGAFLGNPTTAVDAGDYGSPSVPNEADFAKLSDEVEDTEEQIAKERDAGGMGGTPPDIMNAREVSAIGKEALATFGYKGALAVLDSLRPLSQREIRTITATVKAGVSEVPGDWGQSSIIDKAYATIKNYMVRDPRANRTDLASLITDLWRLSEAQSVELAGRLKIAMTKRAQEDLENMSEEALKAAYSAATDESEKSSIAAVLGKRQMGVASTPSTPSMPSGAAMPMPTASTLKTPLQQIVNLMRPIERGGSGMTYAEAKRSVENRTGTMRQAVSTSPDIQEGNVPTLASEKTKKVTEEANRDREKKFKGELKDAWVKDWRKMAARCIGLIRTGKYTWEAIVDAIPDEVPTSTRRMAMRRITTAVFGEDKGEGLPDLPLTDKERLAPEKKKRGRPGRPPKTSPKAVDREKRPKAGRPKKEEIDEFKFEPEEKAVGREATTTKELSDKTNKEREKKFNTELKAAQRVVKVGSLSALYKEGIWDVYKSPSFERVAYVDIDDVDVDDLSEEYSLETEDEIDTFLESEDYGEMVLEKYTETEPTTEDTAGASEGGGLIIGSRVKVAAEWLPTGEESPDLIHDITQLRDGDVEGEIVEVLPDGDVEVAFGETPIVLSTAEIERVADSEYERVTEPIGGTDDVWTDETLEVAEVAQEQQRQVTLSDQAEGAFGPDAQSSRRNVTASVNQDAAAWQKAAATQLVEEMYRKKLIKTAAGEGPEEAMSRKALEIMKLTPEGYYQLQDVVKSASEPTRGLKDPVVLRGQPMFEDPLDDPEFFPT